MMRLKAKFGKKVAHELADGEPKPALEMCNEDDIFAGLRYRCKLGAG